MTVLASVVLGTLSILAFNVLLAAVLMGLGLGLRRAFGLQHASLADCFMAFWTGFSLVILFLLVWNFLLPVGPPATLTVFAGGLVMLFVRRRTVVDALTAEAVPRWTMVSAAAFAIWTAHVSTGALTDWDTALYHMQGVKWARTYPAVPGVANVFGPMGFNNASFVYNAMLDVGPWQGQAWHVSNGVLVTMFGLHLLVAASRLVHRSASPLAPALFALLLLPIAVDYVLDGRVSSFSTVVPSSLLVMIAAFGNYSLWVDRTRSDRDRAYDVFCLIALASAAVSIKLSGAAYAMTLVLTCLVVVFGPGGLPSALRARAVGWTVAAAVFMGGAWVARGLVLTGYPLFPTPVWSVPVDWRVPLEHARAEFDFVYHSARATAENFPYVSGEATGLRVWIRHWLRSSLNDPYEIIVPTALGGLAVLALARSGRWRTAARPEFRAGWIALLPAAVGVGAWTWTAPMPHYGVPFFWSVLAGLGAQVLNTVERDHPARRRLLLRVGLASAATCLIMPVSRALERSEPILGTILEQNVKRPEAGRWYQSGIPQQPMRVFVTNTGVELKVPIGKFGRCWDAPLLCTTNPAPNLRLRVPNRIDKGFTVDGDWQMQDWPEAWRHELLPAMRKAWRRRGLAEAP